MNGDTLVLRIGNCRSFAFVVYACSKDELQRKITAVLGGG